MLGVKVRICVNVKEMDGVARINELMTYCHWRCKRSVENCGMISVFIH
jgi:hypothetical protein